MKDLMSQLKVLRWDDHRYYHQSRINQSLHFVSALSFLTAYVMLFIDPAISALIGWLVGMGTRQTGHYVFEPRGYDHVNDATDEYKEKIKVGFNMRRKTILIAVWLACPLLLYVDPTLFGLMEPSQTKVEYVHDVGLLWLALGVGGLMFRTLHLLFIRDAGTALAWMLKILTDPFHDVKLYHKSPLYLLRGELLDPMTHVHHG
ncbi:MAG: hypothetical protein JNL33_05475 [Betaproteobacteria bacterium]|nr:hypothetical protein [Betaproteobacteria bacterium]MBL8533288.1 hypothetical protein [Betaproteobacteria bacterium]